MLNKSWIHAAAMKNDAIDVKALLLQAGPVEEQREARIAAIRGASQGGHVDLLHSFLYGRNGYGPIPADEQQESRRVAIRGASQGGHVDLLYNLLYGRNGDGLIPEEEQHEARRVAIRGASEGGHVDLLYCLFYGRSGLSNLHDDAVRRKAALMQRVSPKEEHEARIMAIRGASQGGHVDLLYCLFYDLIPADEQRESRRVAIRGASQGGHVDLLYNLLYGRNGFINSPDFRGFSQITVEEQRESNRVAIEGAVLGGHVALLRSLLYGGNGFTAISAEEQRESRRVVIRGASRGGHVVLLQNVLYGRNGFDAIPAEEQRALRKVAIGCVAQCERVVLLQNFLHGCNGFDAIPAEEQHEARIAAIGCAAQGGRAVLLQNLLYGRNGFATIRNGFATIFNPNEEMEQSEARMAAIGGASQGGRVVLLQNLLYGGNGFSATLYSALRRLGVSVIGTVAFFAYIALLHTFFRFQGFATSAAEEQQEASKMGRFATGVCEVVANLLFLPMAVKMVRYLLYDGNGFAPLVVQDQYDSIMKAIEGGVLGGHVDLLHSLLYDGNGFAPLNAQDRYDARAVAVQSAANWGQLETERQQIAMMVALCLKDFTVVDFCRLAGRSPHINITQLTARKAQDGVDVLAKLISGIAEHKQGGMSTYNEWLLGIILGLTPSKQTAIELKDPLRLNAHRLGITLDPNDKTLPRTRMAPNSMSMQAFTHSRKIYEALYIISLRLEAKCEAATGTATAPKRTTEAHLLYRLPPEVWELIFEKWLDDSVAQVLSWWPEEGASDHRNLFLRWKEMFS